MSARAAAARRLLPALAAGLAIWALPSVSAAAEGPLGGRSNELLLAQVVLFVVGGRLMGELMQRLGQPTIIGQILAGMLLGPSVLGVIWPAAQEALFPPSREQTALITGLSEIGILFLLLLAGMETDLALALKLRRLALTVSAAGVAVPFACGLTLGFAMPQDLLPNPDQRLVTALFLGTALSISSLKIVATVVREMNFMRRTIGQLIVGTAVIDDAVGWVIIAITFSLATTGSINFSVAVSVVATLLFLLVSFTVGRRAVFEIIRWTNDNLRSDLPVVTAIIGIMGVMALITQIIGVQAVLGAFVAGILVGQSPILTRQIDEQLRGLTTALFMPVFFGLTGLHTDLRVLADPETLVLTMGLVLIASIGKFGGAFLGALLTRMPMPEALALGFGMNARGSTEVIVASIGLSVGVLDQRLFSMIVVMAVITTLAMPPTLRWALARLPMREEERDRLDREGFEQQSLVGGLERILVTVDRSPSGELAAELAGAFAGLRQMPVTVLEIADHQKRRRRRAAEAPPDTPSNEAPAEEEPASTAGAAAERIRRSARAGAATTNLDTPVASAEPAVLERPANGDVVAEVASQSDKGHDLLFLGVEPSQTTVSPLGADSEALLGAFEGVAALVSARGALRRRPQTRPDILVPFNGDAASTRALEFACILARARNGRVTTFFVRERRARSGWPRRRRLERQAMMEEVARITGHYRLDARTVAGEASVPAILEEARQGRHNLLVIGASPRADSHLSFGPLADGIVEMADRSLLVVLTIEAPAKPAP